MALCKRDSLWGAQSRSWNSKSDAERRKPGTEKGRTRVPLEETIRNKNGGDLPSDKAKFENLNKALRITNVSEEDSGEYFCLASNKMGSIRHTISVRVKGTLCAFLIMTVFQSSTPQPPLLRVGA